MVYAKVKRSFENLGAKSTDFKLETLIKEQFELYGIKEEVGYTFKTLFQIAKIVDISGAHYRNYHSVNLLFADKLAELKGGSKDTEKYLLYHIDLIYLTANIFFRKKEFMISLFYLEEMERQMQRSNQRYYDARVVDLNILKALNNSCLGSITEAKDLIYKTKKKKQYTKFVPKHKVGLAEAMFHFQQGDFKAAKTIVFGWNKSDNYYEKNLGIEWILNKKFIELLLLIELDETDLLESKVISLRRKYGQYFKEREEFQIIPFLGLIKTYGENKSIIKTEKFKNKITRTIKWKPKHEEDIFLMSFYAWLKSKVEGTDLYETTIELVKK